MSPHPHNAPDTEEFDILSVVKYVASRWYWFVLSVPIFLSLAVLYNRTVVPQHEVRAKILIEVDKDRVIYTDDAMSGMDHLFRSKTVNNEIEVLRSRDLIGRTLDSLGLYVAYYDLGVGQQEIYKDQIPFEIRADFNKAHRLGGVAFDIEMVEDDKYLISANGSPLGTFSRGQIITYNDFYFIIDKRFSERPISPLDGPVRCYINSTDALVNSYVGRLGVAESDRDTDAITLSIQETMPERGKAFLGTLMESYFLQVLEDRQRIAENTYDFIDGRLNSNFSRLDSVENAIDRYKRENGITDPAAESKFILEAIKDFELELNVAETQLEITRDLVSRASDRSYADMELSIPNTIKGVADPLLAELLKRLNIKQQEIQRLSETVREDNPLYQEMLSEVDDLRQAVIRTIGNMQDNLVMTRDQIRDQIADYKGQLAELSYDELGLNSMERLRDNKEGIYVYLLKKREEAAMVLASELMDTWVLEQPYVASFFYEPKRSIVIAVGGFLGIFFPCSILLIWMMFDGRLREEKEIKHLLDRPVLGRIPRQKQSDKGPMITETDSLSREAYKRMLLNLRFLNDSYRVIALSSMRSGDGKTHTALHTAMSAVAMGKKTCLLELDLRMPSLAMAHEKALTKSLADHLMGSSRLDEVILTNVNDSGLDIVYSEAYPLDPTTVFMSDRMDKLIRDLKARYDLIVIDTPPIGAVSDAMVLSRLADINLIVAKKGHTTKKDLRTLSESLTTNPMPNIAVLFNGAEAEGVDMGYLKKQRRRLDLGRGGLRLPRIFTQRNGVGESEQKS